MRGPIERRRVYGKGRPRVGYRYACAGLQRNSLGLTVWLTGLSGAGKTTIAWAATSRLSAQGFRTEVLDGDEIRGLLSRDLGFSMEDRNENVRRLAFIADLLTRHGVIVFVAAISPYRAARERALGTHLQFS